MTNERHSPVSVPWWLTAGIFVLATVILFGEFIFSDRMLYGGDTLALGYMARAFFAEQLAAGDFPSWNPRLLGGIPFIEALSAGDSIYPTSLLYYFMEPYRALGWKLVLHVLAGGFFMYGWARGLGLERSAATLGGLAWLLAPVIVTLVLPGNDGKLMVSSLAPLVFWAADSVFRSPSGKTGAGLAGAVALASLTTQFQTAYFLFGSVGAYAVFRTVRLWRGRGHCVPGNSHLRAAVSRFGLFLLCAVLGAGIASVQLIPAAEYVTESSRRIATTLEATPEEAIAYSSSWSLHPEEVAGLVVPEFVGNSGADADWARGTYWGRNAFKGNHEYLGIPVLLLAVFALFGRRRRALRWFMAALSLLWLLFALGTHTPVWRLFYEVVPGISLFRVPSISAFLVSFGATTLFALGVDDLVREAPSRVGFFRTRRGRALLGCLGLLVVGLLLQSSGALGRMWTTVVYPDVDQRGLATLAAAAPFITRGFVVAVLLGILTMASLWAGLERKIPLTVALAALGLLVSLDLGRVDRAFIDTWDFHAWAATDNNTRFLQGRRDSGPPFRVADLRGDDQNVDLAMFGLDLFAGHHPNDLARYRQLLGLEASRREGRNTRHQNVLRLMNVKYLVWPEGAAGGPPYEGAQRMSSAQTGRGVEAVYAYPGLDRAWLAGASTVMDDDLALERILARDFDPASEAVLSAPVPIAPVADASGSVEWQMDTPGHRRLTVRSDGPALLVVSENWFPGWEAEVDGRSTPVHRVNLTLQGVEIPGPGEHSVVLRFTAPTVQSALRVTVFCGFATLLMLSASFVPALLRRRKRD
ncbi:MAG: hypothetical protein OXN18_00330 [Gemmatimonadota bacterium]|nr:hypothetical protein [Gemmatimonadota bacterium]